MAKTGILRDPETLEYYFPQTLWDSIIGRPGNLNSVYDSTIKIRGGDSSDYNDLGAFTLNQSSNADIYIPVFSQTTKGLVPTFTSEQEGDVLTTKGWAQINDLAVTSITAGAGLNTTSANTNTDGGSITSSGTLHLTKCNNNVGSFGPSSNVSPAHGGNFNVPYITVDKYGRVTSASTQTITLPSAGSSAGTIYPMAAYAIYGNPSVIVRPDVFATAFMYPIINGDVTNDCSIITDKFKIQDYNTPGIDGHVPAAALILLYAAYLSRNGFTSGRLEWETHGYGDYFSYLICTGTSMCYKTQQIDDPAIFQSNGITVYTFNWTNYNNSPLPIGINDYNCDAASIGGTSADFIAHKYIFTFSNIQQGDISSLYKVLSAINSDNINTYKDAAESLNAILKNGTQSFNSMTVRIEHKSVRWKKTETDNKPGYNVFNP